MIYNKFTITYLVSKYIYFSYSSHVCVYSVNINQSSDVKQNEILGETQ